MLNLLQHRRKALQRKYDISAFTVNLNNENDLEMKQKMLLKENEDVICGF